MSEHIVGRIEVLTGYESQESLYRTARAMKLLQLFETGKLEILGLRAGVQPHHLKTFLQDLSLELREVTGE